MNYFDPMVRPGFVWVLTSKDPISETTAIVASSPVEDTAKEFLNVLQAADVQCSYEYEIHKTAIFL